MRTTLILDDDLLRDAMKAIGARTKTEAVHEGLRALVSRVNRRALADLRGAFPDAEAAPRRRPDSSRSDDCLAGLGPPGRG